jgi:predicted adenine nucleotide alpha hydrolase (AANH) superfamily ATPase
VPFLYRDWRDGWKEGVEASREAGMYRQQYCGCLYSEWERHRPRDEGTH